MPITSQNDNAGSSSIERNMEREFDDLGAAIYEDIDIPH